MHIVVFYQYYHNPDCAAAARHYTFVREWSKRHRVTVITGNSWYKRRLTKQFDWSPPGVDVKMLDIAYDNSMSFSERLGSFARYTAGAVWAGLRVSDPDVIFGTSTPLSAAWAAAKVARLRRVKWLFEVRDLWPDFPIQAGAIRSPFLKNRLLKMEQKLYRSANHVVTLSPDMTDHVKSCGIDQSRVSTIVNGTDFDLIDAISEEDLSDLRQQYGLAGKRVILYAGAFGRANAIPTLLQTAEALRHREDVRFVLVGDGFHGPDVQAAASSSENVVMPDPAPRHSIMKWFRLADLSLSPFVDLPVLSANSPSKFFDSLGAGTPVIVTNPGWTKKFVESNECGWYVPPVDAGALAARIEEALESPWELARAGVNGRRVALESFDRTRMAGQIEQLMISS
jgi:glycosyltransferase involved in cell wall biosynthesis